jgi:hypothetical protein
MWRITCEHRKGTAMAPPVSCSRCGRVIDRKTELIYGALGGPICADCHAKSGGTPAPTAPPTSGSLHTSATREPDKVSFAPLAVILVDFAWGLVVGFTLGQVSGVIAMFYFAFGHGEARNPDLAGLAVGGLVLAGIPGLLGAIWRCELAGLVAMLVGLGSGTALVIWDDFSSAPSLFAFEAEDLIVNLVMVAAGYLAGCAIGLAGRSLVRGHV